MSLFRSSASTDSPANASAENDPLSASSNAVALAHNSDILIHEATFSHEKLERAVEHFHTTNIQAMEIADKAKVKRLILTHFSPRLSNEDIRDWVWNGQPCVIFDERQEI